MLSLCLTVLLTLLLPGRCHVAVTLLSLYLCTCVVDGAVAVAFGRTADGTAVMLLFIFLS